MLLAVIIVFAAISKPFFTVTNLSNILLQASATAIAAINSEADLRNMLSYP